MSRRRMAIWWIAGGAAGLFGVPVYGAGVLGQLAAISPILVVLPYLVLIALGVLALRRSSTTLLLVWAGASWLLLSATIAIPVIISIVGTAPVDDTGSGLLTTGAAAITALVVISGCVALVVAWLTNYWLRGDDDADVGAGAGA